MHGDSMIIKNNKKHLTNYSNYAKIYVYLKLRSNYDPKKQKFKAVICPKKWTNLPTKSLLIWRRANGSLYY